MELFRITKSEYAQKLFAPGFPGRWNKAGEEVIYAASSRSLACLENLVQGKSLVDTLTFRTMVIYVPDHSPVLQININDLPKAWNQSTACHACQRLGSDWYQSGKSLILKVPSAVIPDEFNLVINTRHREFNKVKLVDILPFYFDKRL